MIITDSAKRPSERFIEVVSNYFLSEGYEFKKSEKSFIRESEKGFEKVYLQFFTTVNLVSVSIAWSINLLTLEKIFAAFKGEPKKYKNSISLYTHLPIHTRWAIPKVNHTWDLFDNTTFRCDDLVLNKAAEGIIDAYKKYVLRFFQFYDNYENLEQILNGLPIKSTPFAMGHLGYSKQAAFGLFLAKYFDRPNFKSLVDEYKKLATSLPSDMALELKDIIHKTQEFLNTNNINEVLAP